jgi:histone deacetylase 1/2
MYAMVGTRPDLAYTLSVLSRSVALGSYTTAHWDAAKRTLRYLKGTATHALTLGGTQPLQLEGFSDSSWADDHTDRRSSQGYGFTLGHGLVSWRSTRSSSVALSSCEAELYAGTMAAQEAKWLTALLAELGHPQPTPTLWCDNASTIALTKDAGVFHARTKHIELRHFYIRELVSRNELCVQHVSSADNLADIFTKPLTKVDHRRLTTALGLSPSGGVPL